MFKKLQKLSVTAIALTLIYSFSIEMLSMASSFGPQTCGGTMQYGGTWKREIPIKSELALHSWQLYGDPNAFDPATGLPLFYFPYYDPNLWNNCQFFEVPEQRLDKEVNYFDWLTEELQHLSEGIFDKFCNVTAAATVLDFIKKHNLKTPIYFYDDVNLNKFKQKYEELKSALEFTEDPFLQDENCFFAENFYLMACELFRYKSKYSPLDWKNIEQSYSDFLKIFSHLFLQNVLK